MVKPKLEIDYEPGTCEEIGMVAGVEIRWYILRICQNFTTVDQRLHNYFLLR